MPKGFEHAEAYNIDVRPGAVSSISSSWTGEMVAALEVDQGQGSASAISLTRAILE